MRNAAILLSIRRRDFVQAEQLAEQTRVDGIADASTFGLRGHALSSLGRHDEAAVAYNEALKLAPGDAYVRHLAASAGTASTASRAPDEYVRTFVRRLRRSF
jgi:Flp pilus assembly protein TadD